MIVINAHPINGFLINHTISVNPIELIFSLNCNMTSWKKNYIYKYIEFDPGSG